NSNRVYQSAEQELGLYAPLVGKITLADINRELRQLWGHDSRLVSVTGDVKLGEHANKSISDVFQSSTVKPVAAFNKNSVNTFPYLPLPEKVSTFKKQNINPALDIERVVFDNGLILNLKKTEFDRNSLQISVDFGHGALEEPLPGMAMVAGRVINGSGTGTLIRSAFDAVLAGTSVDLRFRIGEASFTWVGSSLTKDFEKLLQALYSVLFDAGFRESVFDTTISRTEQMYKMIGRDVEGAVPLKILPFLASGSPHFGLVPQEKIASLKYEQLAEWAKTIVPDTGFEISLVGDFDRDNVVAAIGKYFSGVELTGDRNIIPEKIVFPEGKAISVEVSTSIAKSVVFLAWPTEDFTDIHRTREFHLLAAVLEDRLRKVIREKLGATYSPEVYSSNSKVYNGYGFLAAKLIVKPGQEKKILDEILRLAEELRSEGVTEEELARAREPMLTSINETLKDNSYWLYTVLSGSSRNPEQLDWPESIFHDYSSISRQEINLLAKKYLINSRAATARVIPDIKQ
ncbi:MAG: insulinase family protein, partial [Deltaproteobacteria bacterium]|nr:insulinase family protein [Deltaproteobacteria bacterium]